MDSSSGNSAEDGSVRSVGVIGGGTAGYFVALALKQRFADMRVSVVEAPNIPIIGVGEATTTLLPPFLYVQLGIDPVELHERVRPTFKLGIKFDWGQPGTPGFSFPFGDTDPLAAQFHDRSLRTQSLSSLLMDAERSLLARDATGQVRSLLPEVKFAYHLHNAPFVAFLAERARAVGIEHVEAEIAAPSLRDSGHRGEEIDHLRTTDGRELRFDLYIDASGFRSILLGQALSSPFTSFDSSLFCDTAIVGALPETEIMSPYTFAATMDAGWCWKIPVEGSNHRGYVFSSSFLTADQAEAEFRVQNPGLGSTWSVRFRSGRRRDFWIGNTVAVGNAYGFVEPLESTALHMVILEIEWLVAGLLAGPSLDRGQTNRQVGAHWDYLRWFLSVHYRFNHQRDTAFWRACRNDTNIDGLLPAIEHFQTAGFRGPLPAGVLTSDPAFGPNGLATILLGQVPSLFRVETSVPADAWRGRLERQEAFVAASLPHREALALLHEKPDYLRAMLDSPKSWLRGHEFVRVAADGRASHMPHGFYSR